MTALAALATALLLLLAGHALRLLYHRWHAAYAPRTLTEHEAQHKLYGGPSVHVEYKALAHTNHDADAGG